MLGIKSFQFSCNTKDDMKIKVYSLANIYNEVLYQSNNTAISNVK